MAIIDYKDDFHRDTKVYGEQVYYGNGQGCETIWFKNVKEVRKFVKKFGRITGRDAGLCKKCACHYSYGTKEWKKYPEYACKEWKKERKKEVM